MCIGDESILLDVLYLVLKRHIQKVFNMWGTQQNAGEIFIVIPNRPNLLTRSE